MLDAFCQGSVTPASNSFGWAFSMLTANKSVKDTLHLWNNVVSFSQIYLEFLWSILKNGVWIFLKFFIQIYGMLRHSLATLEGCNLMWHIVSPSSRPTLVCMPVWTKWMTACQHKQSEGWQLGHLFSLQWNLKCLSSLL